MYHLLFPPVRFASLKFCEYLYTSSTLVVLRVGAPAGAAMLVHFTSEEQKNVPALIPTSLTHPDGHKMAAAIWMFQ